jgi:hypothetical protein
MPFLATVLGTLLLAIPAMSVELFRSRGAAKDGGGNRLNYFLRGSLVIDPIQKFDKPLTINPKQDFLILWIILRKFLIAATKNGPNVYPNLTVD